MSFDLYFAGAYNKVADEYMLKLGANRLQSQLIGRRCVDKWANNKIEKSKLFLDSGAYTAYTKGIDIDPDEYIDYINSVTEHLTIFAQLDKIPGRFNQPKSLQDILDAPRQSWDNYLYMYDRLKEPYKLVPIFHQGEDYKWLRNMLEWRDSKGNAIQYIGISPAVDVPGLETFLDKSFDIIAKSSNPNVKTHAFGMTQLKILEMYPYTSADSTSWKLSAGMGSIYTPWGTVYISDRKKNDSNYIANLPGDAYKNIKNYVENYGINYEDAVKHDYVRYIINIKYLMNWAENYTYKGGEIKRNSLF